jgi:hypothetical protein
MKLKKVLTASILLAIVALVGGCHYDGHRRDYGNNRYGSYRDGFRDGRSYERRRDNWRDSRWDDRDRDYWRRRW